MMFVFCLEGRK